MKKSEKAKRPSYIHIEIDGYILTISPGNDKLGYVHSISVTPGPGITCPLGVPCWNEGCYARNMEAWRDTIRMSWARNLEAIKNIDPAKLAEAVAAKLNRRGVRLFRFNVGGDFGLKNYWEFACKLAELCPNTAFYAYTKFFGLADRPRPRNFNLVLSAWGERRPCTDKAAVVYVDDEKTPIPAGAHKCTGHCQSCLVCAFARPGQSVVIQKH